jgi:hypothetical protein
VELLDRYLSAVRMHLPKEQADDIIQELSDNLRSQMEDREAELGRPLTSAEEEAMLKEHGPPMAVAGRYRADNRSLTFGRRLIGPELFPRYLQVLAINAAFTLFASIAAQVAFGSHRPVVAITGSLLFSLAIQFVIVTLVFIVADRYLTRNPDLWLHRKAGSLGRRDPRAESRLGALIELVVIVVVALWWLSLPRYVLPYIHSTPGFIAAGPTWPSLYTWVLVLTLVQIIPAAVAVVRPQWRRFRIASNMIVHGAAAVAVFYFIRVGIWVVPLGTGATLAAHERLANTINQACNFGLMWFGIVSIYLFARAAWRLTRLGRETVPAARSNGPAKVQG